MKKLKKLVLVQLEQNELTRREAGQVKGGIHSCACGYCDYLPGYSGCYDNGHANCTGNYNPTCMSGSGSNVYCGL
ncbi:MAG: hypothetical protein LBV43_10335 [Prevotella sp.]|jgi:hypothetical protein|nr:hypothetical protein [Prevotella sp.]